MDGIDVDMDNISRWLEKVLKWVARRGVPGIPYIGKAPGGYGNNPAEHLEVVYLLDKGVDRYLRDMRLQNARFLLRDTTMLVEEVAFSVGFNDPLHFSRVFRTATGLSPTA